MNAYEYLMLVGSARNKMDVATRAFAGVISSGYGATRLIPPLEYGMGTTEFKALMEEYFPGALGKVITPMSVKPGKHRPAEFRSDEYDGILSILKDNLSRKDKEGEWMAHSVAMSVLGCDSVWQNMGLPNRKALSELIKDYFAPLSKKNKGMKWKKFIYKQLCESKGMNPCMAPTCEDCSEYEDCFGDE